MYTLFLYKKQSFWVSNLRIGVLLVVDGWHGWRASVGSVGEMLLLLLLLLKYCPEEKNVECLLLKQK